MRRDAAPFLVGTLSLACCLFLLAVSWLLHGNVQSLIARLEAEPRLVVFLHQNASVQEQESLVSEVRKWPEICDIKVSLRLQPIEDGRGSRGHLPGALEGFWADDSGMRVEILFTSRGNPPAEVAASVERLRRFQHIAEVLDERDLLERFEPFYGFLTSTGWWAVALLALLSLLIAFACSAMALTSCMEELEVSLLLGGSRFQVYFPFYGRAILGGITAGAISAGGVVVLLDRVRWFFPGASLMNADWTHWERALLTAGMVLCGIGLTWLGCWCSLLYARHGAVISSAIDVRPPSPVIRRVW
jgi:cell division protein FtsX